jgi:hypothetical protein
MNREKKILDALRHVYGKGRMVDALAATVDGKFDGWLRGEGQAAHHGLEYAVQMECWNWFSGGGTAEIAARRVVAAVQEAS